MGEHLTDTNVGNIDYTEYISKQDAIMEVCNLYEKLKFMQSANAVTYSITIDGTLKITVPKGTYKNINRVLVEEDGTHWGGLYYAD